MSNYPPGAEFDPRAPWNLPDLEPTDDDRYEASCMIPDTLLDLSIPRSWLSFMSEAGEIDWCEPDNDFWNQFMDDDIITPSKVLTPELQAHLALFIEDWIEAKAWQIAEEEE